MGLTGNWSAPTEDCFHSMGRKGNFLFMGWRGNFGIMGLTGKILWPSSLGSCKNFITNKLYYGSIMDTMQTEFLNSQPVILDSVTEEQDLWYSHDFAMTLGVKARVVKNDMAPTRTRVLRSITPDTYTYLEMIVSSPYGPLRPIDKALLTALTTMAKEQTEEDKEKYFSLKEDLRGRFVVFFTLSELCRALSYDPNTMIREVKESLERLASQNVQEKTFKYSTKTKKYVDNIDNYKVIDQFGKIRVIKSNEGMQSLAGIFYVVLHQSVVFKMSKRANIGWIKSSEYHKLKGILKSVYEFICSKRDNFGKTYSFDMEELSGLLSLEGSSYKNRETIKKYLDQIKNQIGGFNFDIKRDSAKDNYVILLSFDVESEVSEEEEGLDPFFAELKYAYGLDALNEAKFSASDLEVLRYELAGAYKKIHGKDTLRFNQVDIDPIEFAIDISLFQIIVGKYAVSKTIRGFIKFIFEKICEETVEFPGDYSQFITVRNAIKRKKERMIHIENELRKREESEKEVEKNLNANFEDFWKDRLEKDENFVNALRVKAYNQLAEENSEFEKTPLKNLRVEERAKSLCRHIFETGTFGVMAESMVKEMKKLKSEDIQALGFAPQQQLQLDSANL